MKGCWLLGCFFLVYGLSCGQSQSTTGSPRLRPVSSESAYLINSQPQPQATRWSPDSQAYFRYTSPWMTTWPAATGNQPYFLGSTSTQSFNKGKFGTIYYYDVMGNMRYARTFIDIAGKNKRGLKLLLPTIVNQRMVGQH